MSGGLAKTSRQPSARGLLLQLRAGVGDRHEAAAGRAGPRPRGRRSRGSPRSLPDLLETMTSGVRRSWWPSSARATAAGCVESSTSSGRPYAVCWPEDQARRPRVPGWTRPCPRSTTPVDVRVRDVLAERLEAVQPALGWAGDVQPAQAVGDRGLDRRVVGPQRRVAVVQPPDRVGRARGRRGRRARGLVPWVGEATLPHRGDRAAAVASRCRTAGVPAGHVGGGGEGRVPDDRAVLLPRGGHVRPRRQAVPGLRAAHPCSRRRAAAACRDRVLAPRRRRARSRSCCRIRPGSPRSSPGGCRHPAVAGEHGGRPDGNCEVGHRAAARALGRRRRAELPRSPWRRSASR